MSDKKESPNKIGIEVGKFGGGINKEALIAKRPDDANGTLKRMIFDLSDSIVTISISLCMVIMATLFSIASPRILGVALDNIFDAGFDQKFINCCVMLAGCYCFEGLFSWGDAFLMNKVAQKTVADLRKKSFDKLSKLPLLCSEKYSTGELMSRIVNDVDSVATVLSSGFSQLLKSVITIVVTMIMMIRLSPVLTIAGLILLPVRAIVIKKVLKKSKVIFFQRQKELGVINSFGDEIISARSAIRTYSMFDVAEEKYNMLCDDYQRVSEKADWMAGMTGSIAGCLTNISYVLVSVVGIVMLIKGNNITLGIISSMLIYTKQCSRPLNEIANQFNLLMASLAGAERVYSLLDEQEEEHISVTFVENKFCDSNVEFRNVSFSYEDNKPVIKDLNLQIPSGSTVALVGETGSGKTTLMNLLEKFYSPDSGCIFVGGVDISKVSEAELRSKLGVVLQDSYIFSGSIKDNILIGKPGASDDEVEAAARMANAHDFITRLPDAYETRVTSGGTSLSLGQRQMITIARVFLKNPELLILDEATSSVDAYSEKCISNALMELMKDRTSIIIAHRAETLQSADMIAVLANGKIAEMGTYDELISQKAVFCQIFGRD